jgi:hypothetical protein
LNEIEKPQVWRKARQPMRYKNRVTADRWTFVFLGLRKNWLCSAKITLSFLCPGNVIFIFGDELVALMPILFRKNEISSFGDGNPRPDTISIHNRSSRA